MGPHIECFIVQAKEREPAEARGEVHAVARENVWAVKEARGFIDCFQCVLISESVGRG